MATDIFAKIGDIKGESTDSRHPEEINVLSFAWGVATTAPVGGGGGGGASKPSFQDFSFVHRIDKASPLLLRACATGTHLRDVTITHRKAGHGPADYLVIRLSDAAITSVTHSGSNDADYIENVTLRYGSVAVEYRPQKPDGSLDPAVSFSFDVRNGRAG